MRIIAQKKAPHLYNAGQEIEGENKVSSPVNSKIGG